MPFGSDLVPTLLTAGQHQFLVSQCRTCISMVIVTGRSTLTTDFSFAILLVLFSYFSITFPSFSALFGSCDLSQYTASSGSLYVCLIRQLLGNINVFLNVIFGLNGLFPSRLIVLVVKYLLVQNAKLHIVFLYLYVCQLLALSSVNFSQGAPT